MTVILTRTLIIYILLSLVLRMLGKRQVGELEISELVSTLILSEIAALPIDNPDIPLLYAVLPILLLLSLEIVFTYLKNKSSFLKKVFESRPNVLIDRGEIDQKEMSRVRISIEELLGELRLQGVGDPSDVYYAILEQSGQLSVILKAEKQPLTVDGGDKTEHGIAHALILDGDVCETGLSRFGKDTEWLKSVCQKRGHRISDVFLCTCDDSGEISIVKRKKK